MKHFIPAAGFAVRTWPPETRLVALISSYFDDSQSTGDVWVIGGCAGYVNQWEHLEQLWSAALAKHGVPYFHMREMGKPEGVFAKWWPPEEHQDEVAAFFIDLIDAIAKCGMKMISSAAWVKDIERFNREENLSLEPYSMAAYGCLAQVGLRYEDKPATAVFDHVEKVTDKLAKARQYADSDKHIYPGLCDRIVASGLPRNLTFRDVPAMQVADLIAWEIRKAHFGMREWIAHPDRPPLDRKAQWQHYVDWTNANTGGDPVFRKSLQALLDATSNPNAVAWDYDQLRDTHKARRGVWT